MFKAVIFDFDLTLVDSIYAITQGLNQMARHFKLPEVTEDDTRRVISLESDDLWSNLWGDYDQEWNTYFLEKVAHQEKNYLQVTTDTLEFLELLKSLGLTLGLATNRHNAWETLAEVDLAKYFDTAVGTCDVPRSKPAPDMLFKAMEQMGVSPGHTIFIGDAASDMKAAAQAGILGIGLSTGVASQELLYQAGAWKVSPSLVELTSFFISIR